MVSERVEFLLSFYLNLKQENTDFIKLEMNPLTQIFISIGTDCHTRGFFRAENKETHIVLLLYEGKLYEIGPIFRFQIEIIRYVADFYNKIVRRVDWPSQEI